MRKPPTHEQYAIVSDQVGNRMRYLRKLADHLAARLGRTHELVEAAEKAYDAAYRLRMKLHYASFKSGIMSGKYPDTTPPKPEGESS